MEGLSLSAQYIVVTFFVSYRMNTTMCTLASALPPVARPLMWSRKWKSNCKCMSLRKKGQRFFSKVALKTSPGDATAINHLIRKFVAAPPKSAALDALLHLISPHSLYPHLSHIALPLYSKMTEASSFEWNSKLVANLVAFLDKQGQYTESAALLSDSITKLQCRERDLVQFYSNLIASHSQHNSDQGFGGSYACLNQLVCNSKSVFVKRQGYRSMVRGLCEMNRPRDAEDLIAEMRGQGVKPSKFEYRYVLYGYGRAQLFEDMGRVLDEMEREGFKVDTVCANMVLSSYRVHNDLPKMVMWLQKMISLGIPFSIRTYNSVLNSCPSFESIQQHSSNVFPISMDELMRILSKDESMLVKELIVSSVLDEAIKWDVKEAKLDLHGMCVSSAYLIMLQWMEEMRKTLNDGLHIIPAEVTIVCGLGNHSRIRGVSPVKTMVKRLMFKSNSPLRIDRQNKGCFVAKGKSVRKWLS